MFYVNSNIDFKKIIDCSKTPIIVYDLKQLQYTLDTVTKYVFKIWFWMRCCGSL